MMLTTHKTHIFNIKKIQSYQTLNFFFSTFENMFLKHNTKHIFCIMSTLNTYFYNIF